MYLNSVEGLHTAIQGTNYYKTKRPTAKPILIDRCNFVINAIVQGNRHNWNVKDYGSVPLHRDILRAQLGCRENLTIINLLKDLDYIKVDDSYISQSYANKLNKKRVFAGQICNVFAESKKYSLTDKAKEYGIVHVGVLSEKSVKRFLKYKANLLRHYLKDTQIHSKIFYNLSNLYFNYEGAKKVHKEYTTDNTNKDQSEFYDVSYNALKKINNY